jgi:glycosyltransferase involved in cell wall biosynthesis
MHSALGFAAAVQGRVVLVDDGSTDTTETMIKRDFRPALDDGSLIYLHHDTNRGVTAAKNTVFDQSPPGWVLFLDSDDELIQESAATVADTLARHDDEALIFFRCVDQNGALVGQAFAEPQRLSLSRYATHTSYGESLVAINKTVAPERPFDADLHGYEGIGCARLIERFGPALLTTVVARRYDRTRDDRLSSFAGTLKRADRLARGHLRYLRLFGRNMRISTKLSFRIKVLVYFLAGLIASILWSRNAESR